MPTEQVETSLADQASTGLALDRPQAAMVANLATSRCRVQVALAPAGSGKTAALRVLAQAWEACGGDALGLTPTAVAAEELGRAIGTRAETLAKFLHEVGRNALPDLRQDGLDEGRGVGPGTLVLIDEAGMAGTRDLAAVVRHVVRAKGSVRLVGDDQQLSAVAAGGIFTDLAQQGHAHGTTATLTQLHRFTDPTEGTATLAIRDGDPTALNHYFDRGRVHTGDASTAIEAAYAAWATDQQSGQASLLLAATRDTVAEINQRARQDRLEATGGPLGPEVGLADGARASTGDLLITRRNDRTLRTGAGSWVKNGDRWRVLDVRPDGNVSVERHDSGARNKPGPVTLPAAYVAEHVQLGYASTIHGAQGATVDTTHTVLTGTETRQGLYVALSRGREANHLYVGEPAASLDGVGTDVQDTSVDPRQVLTDVLARDGRALSATTVEHGDTSQLLREAVLAYQDALPVLAQRHLGPERMVALDNGLETWMPGLTEQPDYPHLRGQLALRWADGRPPQTVIEEATWYRGTQSLTEAEDPAAALTWRISGTTPPSHRGAPLPWLPDVPPALRYQPETSDYLDRLTRRVHKLAERITDEARQASASDRMPWQRALPLDVDDQLIGDLAVFRAAHDIPATDTRPTVPPQLQADSAKHQARLQSRLNAPADLRAPQPADPSPHLRDKRQAERYRLAHNRSVDASVPR